MLHARNKTITPLGWYVMMYFIYCESFRVARKERAGFFFLSDMLQMLRHLSSNFSFNHKLCNALGTSSVLIWLSNKKLN